ncbi:hypothetical protein GPA19_05170 [Azoarcus indigens]|uniref:Uncharacterized protein n=1 Tax=Azoarcus indigens TaxID=29545 RepID=A0A4R6DVM6_9RHOO|nr:hypothetical protein [Azoarcus indigens]NMG64335.1 hypothetical protein [Azoarcus indigens]TDN49213.1 hypothetical protein C7389_11264 [Azoarcus indigens]
MSAPDDFWNEEDFEDTVAAALIACFESKIRKQRNLPKWLAITESELQFVKKIGPYIPSNSRVILPASSQKLAFDVENDPLPEFGAIAGKNPQQGSNDPSVYNGYFLIHLLRKVTRLPRHWEREGAGQLYELTVMSADDNGVSGDKNYFSVAKDGELFTCSWRHPEWRVSADGQVASWKMQMCHGFCGLVLLADRRHCWTITAQEKEARAHLGCMQEEIKSLLYARSLPMTSTGRKRPILHLVESHRRRMRNGTDVDVTAFLRGAQVVEIGGTVFKVSPPSSMQPKVSRNSQIRYYADAPVAKQGGAA